jgi:D-serine deaminase-like pyridoxal phosphate-dependent protein
VLASVISTPSADRAVVNAGLKSISGERGPPWMHGCAGVECAGISDEHCKLTTTPGVSPPSLGKKIWLIPGHCDPTVNLHDRYVGVRDGRVEALWPIVPAAPAFERRSIAGQVNRAGALIPATA